MTFRTLAAGVAAIVLAGTGVTISAQPSNAMEAVFDVGDLVLTDNTCTDHTVTSNFTFTESDAPTRYVMLRVLDPELEQIHSLRFIVLKNEATRTDHFIFCPGELISGTYTVTGEVVQEDVQARAAVNDKWATTFEVYVPPRVAPTPTTTPTRAGTAMLRKVDRGIRLVLTGGTYEQKWRVKVRLGRDHTYVTKPGQSLIRTFRWTTGTHTVKVYTDGQRVAKRSITIR
jgi:hypothetical protein